MIPPDELEGMKVRAQSIADEGHYLGLFGYMRPGIDSDPKEEGTIQLRLIIEIEEQRTYIAGLRGILETRTEQVEALRAALRELHEASGETEKWVFSYRDYAGKWRTKLRDALSKARAALGEK